MEANKVDMFMMAHGQKFESHDIGAVRNELLEMDDSKWGFLQTIDFKNPTTILIVSLLAGTLGIDRFMIGDTGMGVGKLLTCGGFGIWAIIDWFLIMPATKKKNVEKLKMFVNSGGQVLL